MLLVNGSNNHRFNMVDAGKALVSSSYHYCSNHSIRRRLLPKQKIITDLFILFFYERFSEK